MEEWAGHLKKWNFEVGFQVRWGARGCLEVGIDVITVSSVFGIGFCRQTYNFAPRAPSERSSAVRRAGEYLEIVSDVITVSSLFGVVFCCDSGTPRRVSDVRLCTEGSEQRSAVPRLLPGAHESPGRGADPVPRAGGHLDEVTPPTPIESRRQRLATSTMTI